MEDNGFVFDGVFGFLSSPMWLVPVMHFIDNQSVVFNEADENLHEWQKLHKQYGELVESLLSSYLHDVGITEEQFMQACKTPGLEDRPQMQPIFEQLWASEDFEIFKRMMIQKNVELELQALELVRKRQGKKSKKSKSKSRTMLTEDAILAEVMKQSELEYQEHQKQVQESDSETKGEAKFDDAMEKVLSESTNHFEKLEQEVLKKEQETQQCVEESIKQNSSVQSQKQEEVSPEKAKQASPKHEKPKSPEPKSPPSAKAVKSKSPDIAAPIKTKTATPLAPIRASAGSQAASEWMKSAREESKSDAPSSSSSTTVAQAASMSGDDMSKRIEYLKQQRDRLLSLKKAEREKQLEDYSKTESSKKRPTSARVARQAVSGVPNAGAGAGDDKPEVSKEDAKKMAMRKALAEKLKKQVINK